MGMCQAGSRRAPLHLAEAEVPSFLRKDGELWGLLWNSMEMYGEMWRMGIPYFITRSTAKWIEENNVEKTDELTNSENNLFPHWDAD